MRVLEDGRVEIVDPDPSLVELIRSLDPTFTIRREPLPGFTRPRLLATRDCGAGVPASELSRMGDGALWRVPADTAADGRCAGRGEASVLDVKVELAARMLKACALCAHRCQVDRTRGGRGACGLGAEAHVYEAYVHIAEEPPINPAFNVSLRGCGLRCRYCQQFEALDPRGAGDEVFSPSLWREIDLSGARSLVFVGGNPTEGLPAILRFLRAAPMDLAVPVGRNSSGFDAPDAIRLLDGVCDVYVPDFKYGNDRCARRLSGAPGYVDNALAVIEEMCRQGVPVYVRMLVLPGHAACCHLPALELLAPLRTRVRLQVLAQYSPDFLIGTDDGTLARRPRAAEIAEVRQAAQDHGFSSSR